MTDRQYETGKLYFVDDDGIPVGQRVRPHFSTPKLGPTENEQRLLRCIEMAMGCLDPDAREPDERLAWYRLLDAKEGREPRASLT